MGLAIVRAILLAHGGGIEVVSGQAEGACFRFWVPLVETQPSGAEDESKERLGQFGN
jgi:signal transduction histidine kinase